MADDAVTGVAEVAEGETTAAATGPVPLEVARAARAAKIEPANESTSADHAGGAGVAETSGGPARAAPMAR